MRCSSNRHSPVLALAAVAALALAGCGESHSHGAEASDGHDGPATTAHTHTETVEVAADRAAPTLGLEATPDAKSGVNVRVSVANFAFAPQHASGSYVEGEGHAHLYVDGKKIGRLYGEWFHLDGAEPGPRQLRVELSSNDHRTLTKGGRPIEATTTVIVPGTPAPVDATINVAWQGGKSTLSGPTKVKPGQRVRVVVDSDVADEVHLHGYDRIAPVAPSQPATIEFTASISGRFEVELEKAKRRLFELQVG